MCQNLGLMVQPEALVSVALQVAVVVRLVYACAQHVYAVERLQVEGMEHVHLEATSLDGCRC